jgi:hypothetical protein
MTTQVPTQTELFAYLKKQATEEAECFANDAKFDAVKIMQRIANRRELMLRLGDSGSMHPGTSTRYWLDCYLAALQNTLESLKVPS